MKKREQIFRIYSIFIIWNEDLNIEMETIYEEGKILRIEDVPTSLIVANAIFEARNKYGLTQKDLAEKTGIVQSDISKIERGVANPSINTLNRISKALNSKLNISIN